MEQRCAPSPSLLANITQLFLFSPSSLSALGCLFRFIGGFTCLQAGEAPPVAVVQGCGRGRCSSLLIEVTPTAAAAEARGQRRGSMRRGGGRCRVRLQRLAEVKCVVTSLSLLTVPLFCEARPCQLAER